MNRLNRTRVILWSVAASVCICHGFQVSQAWGAKDDETKKTPDCVYVPTPHDIVEKMLDMAQVTKKDVVYDLGCGDGRIVVQAARKRGCKGVGFEIDSDRIREAHENIKQNKVGHLVTIKEEDLFKADLSEATVLPMYLLPNMLERLKPTLAKLKPGVRIVSHDYRFRDVEPDEVITLTSKETSSEVTLYLFTLPLREKPSDEDE